jgi:hypothetical protein
VRLGKIRFGVWGCALTVSVSYTAHSIPLPKRWSSDALLPGLISTGDACVCFPLHCAVILLVRFMAKACS